MRECIVEQLKYKTDISVFTEAQHQVYTLMHRDSYPRFLLSSIIEDLRRLLTGKLCMHILATMLLSVLRHL